MKSEGFNDRRELIRVPELDEGCIMKSEGFNDRRELNMNYEQGAMNEEQGDIHQKPTESQRQLMHRGWHINE